jgi:hypothetical protein
VSRVRSFVLCLAPTLALAAAPAMAQGPAAPTQTLGDTHRVTVVACFLLNSMTRSAPERARREDLLRAALKTGCLGLPEASPFRGVKRAADPARAPEPAG